MTRPTAPDPQGQKLTRNASERLTPVPPAALSRKTTWEVQVEPSVIAEEETECGGRCVEQRKVMSFAVMLA